MSRLRQRLRALERRPRASRHKLPLAVWDAIVAGRPVDLRPWQPVVDAMRREAEGLLADDGEGPPAADGDPQDPAVG